MIYAGTYREMGSLYSAMVLGWRCIFLCRSHLENGTGEAGDNQLDDVCAGNYSGDPHGTIWSRTSMGDALIAQAGISALAVIATEFVAGLILNVALGLGIWDYSNMPGNIMGQVCPQFALLWFVVSIIGIVLMDWMRYAVEGGEKPHYV
jgi:hypothetical protein